MKELFLTKITKPTVVIVNMVLCPCVDFFVLFFPCTEGQAVRGYLETISIILLAIESVKVQTHKNSTCVPQRIKF